MLDTQSREWRAVPAQSRRAGKCSAAARAIPAPMRSPITIASSTSAIARARSSGPPRIRRPQAPKSRGRAR